MGVARLGKAIDDQERNGESEISNRTLTVVILGASPGTSNLGVAALACGTVASICHSFPNARIFLVDYADAPDSFQVQHPGGVTTVELLNIRFSKRFYLPNNIAYLLFLALSLRLLPSREWRNRLLRRNLVLKAIQEADIIGSIAGGDSFSDIYGLGRLIYVALPQVLVQWLGKPLVLLPQTFGPFKGIFAKAIAGYILKRSRTVYMRDPAGSESVHEVAIPDSGREAFAYDMGFALEPRIRTERLPPWLTEYDKNFPLVGLNVSGLLYIGGYTKRNMFGIQADYPSLIRKIIDHLVTEHSVRVMLVPHVLGADADSESDVLACRNIYETVGERIRAHMFLLGGEYDQHEIKALIGRCDFFLGSRMHACIAAMSQCVPAVGLAYSQKFLGVFKSVGMEEMVIDIRECRLDGIVAILDGAFRRRAEIRKKLEVNIPGVRKSVLELFSRIPVDPKQ